MPFDSQENTIFIEQIQKLYKIHGVLNVVGRRKMIHEKASVG